MSCSRVQQTRLFGVFINGDGESRHFSVEPPKSNGGKAISNKCVLSLFTKDGYSFERFNCNRKLIPDCWCTYRESTFAYVELSFRNKTLFGNG